MPYDPSPLTKKKREKNIKKNKNKLVIYIKKKIIIIKKI